MLNFTKTTNLNSWIDKVTTCVYTLYSYHAILYQTTNLNSWIDKVTACAYTLYITGWQIVCKKNTWPIMEMFWTTWDLRTEMLPIMVIIAYY